MNLNFKKLLSTSSLVIAGSLLTANSYAEAVLVEDESTFLSASLTTQAAFFTQNNSWFGNAQGNIGQASSSWWEVHLEPGLRGHFKLPSNSQLYYELSYIYAKTIDDDAAGSQDNPGKGDLEQAYIGWSSGNLFAAKNLIKLSVGQQDYKLGHGFLLWSGGSAGGKNGAFWTGGRHVFADSGILRVDTGTVKGDLFRLRNRPQSGFSMDLRGANIVYLINKNHHAGFTYIHVKQENNPSIDGADIFDFRVDLDAVSVLPGFSMLAEYVIEDNGDLLDSTGWYAQFAWQFKEFNWQPQLTYRYAALEGDDPDTLKNETFNPLRYGFAGWNTWYQGEIIGEYVLGNSNLNTHMLKLSAKPDNDLTLNLFYFQFDSDQPQSRGISSKNFADEINFIADYSISNSFSVSAVVALAKPDDGAKEMTNGDDNWLLGMIYAYYTF